MNLSPLLGPIRRLESYVSLLASLHDADSLSIDLPLPRSARLAVAASLALDLKRPLVFLTAKPDRALTLTQELGAWSPTLEVMPFPDPDPLFYELLPWSNSTRHARARTLAKLVDGSLNGSGSSDSSLLILASTRALVTRTLSPQRFISLCKELEISQQTYYRWRQKYGGMSPDMIKQHRTLQKENARLRRVIADQALDIAILKEATQLGN